MQTLVWDKTDGPAPAKKFARAMDAKFFTFVGDEPIGVGVYLDVIARDAEGRWPRLDTTSVTDELRAGTYAAGAVVGWDDQLVAACADGRVVAFDRAARAWNQRSAPSETYGAKQPLLAFDPERKLLVAWGSVKKQGRKDDTFVHDGTAWHKPKTKKPPKWADLDTDYGNLAMYWDPTERAILRVGITEVGVFDGAAWKQFPLAGGSVLDDWDRIPCVDASGVLIVQRFMACRDVIRVKRGNEGFVAEKVATFPPAVTREPNSTGSNCAFDVGLYHAPTRSLHAFDDQKNGDRYVADLSALFA
jgi:hypothetical protein